MTTLEPMYKGVVGDVRTKLLAPFHAGTDDSLTVVDVSRFPAAPNYASIRMQNKSCLVTIKYNGIDTGTLESGTLTGIEVVEADVELGLTATYPAGSTVYWSATKVNSDAIIDNIVTLGEQEVASSWGTITGDIADQTDLQDALDAKQVKLPNAPEAGRILKSTNAEGGIEWGSSSTVTTSWGDIIGTLADQYDLQAALNSKANAAALFNKVDKVEGKGLSTNDYDNSAKAIVDNITSELDSKADTEDLNEHIADVNNPHAVTKAQVGLENVDNTSDLAKPISTATQSALDTKVTAETGKRLMTDAEGTKLSGIDTGAQVNVIESVKVKGTAQTVSDKAVDIPAATTSGYGVVKIGNGITVVDGVISVSSGGEAGVDAITVNGTLVPVTDKVAAITITKTTAGLENVDNTADTDKPVSTATQTALNLKVDKITGKGLSTNDYTNTDQTKLNGIAEGAQVNVLESVSVDGTPLTITNKGVNVDLSGKVDKVDGKGLSSNDYTTAEKTKLSGIAAGAEVNVQADWEEDDTTSDAYILNKPTIPDVSGFVPDTRKVNGQALSTDVTITIPTAVSDLTNDSGFQTSTQVTSAISTHNLSNTAHDDIRTSVSTELSRAEGVEASLQNQIDAIVSKTDVVDVVGTYAELQAYDTTKLTNNDIVKVLVDESHSNAISYYRWQVNLGGTNQFVYVGSQGPFYTKSEADGYFVPQQRTVNGQALSGNVTLDYDDVNALPDTTTLADLDDDATHRLVTDTQITAWNSKQSALTFDNVPTEDSSNPVKSGGVYSALAGKEPVITKNSAFNKNFGAVASVKMDGTASAGTSADVARIDHVHPTDTSRASASDLSDHIADTNNPHEVTKAQLGLGSVVDGAQVNVIETVKVNGTALVPASKAVDITVPTKTSDLNNDSGYITSVPVTSVNSKTGAVSLSYTDLTSFPDYIPMNANVSKSGKDASDIYVTTTWELPSSAVVSGMPAKWTSVLSGGTTPRYTTRTMTVYSSDKTTVLRTYTFTRTYDADDVLISEVLQ